MKRGKGKKKRQSVSNIKDSHTGYDHLVLRFPWTRRTSKHENSKGLVHGEEDERIVANVIVALFTCLLQIYSVTDVKNYFHKNRSKMRIDGILTEISLFWIFTEIDGYRTEMSAFSQAQFIGSQVL